LHEITIMNSAVNPPPFAGKTSEVRYAGRTAIDAYADDGIHIGSPAVFSFGYPGVHRMRQPIAARRRFRSAAGRQRDI
jgi:hypothetical protein